jgi:hypothetical protein
MNRRTLLRATTALAVVSVAACSATAPTVSQIATDAYLIASGLSSAIGFILLLVVLFFLFR